MIKIRLIIGQNDVVSSNNYSVTLNSSGLTVILLEGNG